MSCLMSQYRPLQSNHVNLNIDLMEQIADKIHTHFFTLCGRTTK